MGIGAFNAIGMFVLLVLLVLFAYTLHYTLTFQKSIAFKIRIILRNTVERGWNLGELYFPLRKEVNKTVLYKHSELVHRTEIIKRHNHHWRNVFTLMLDRYNHILYLPSEYRWRSIEKSIILRQPSALHFHIYISLIIFSFSIAVICALVV